MTITMVKKITLDGEPCRKCAEVDEKLSAAGLTDKIDRIVIADERDQDSEGMQLAKEHSVELAPFFIVENDDGSTQIYTVYFRFVKEVLQQKGLSEQQEIDEIMDKNPDLDFI